MVFLHEHCIGPNGRRGCHYYRQLNDLLPGMLGLGLKAKILGLGLAARGLRLSTHPRPWPWLCHSRPWVALPLPFKTCIFCHSSSGHHPFQGARTRRPLHIDALESGLVFGPPVSSVITKVAPLSAADVRVLDDCCNRAVRKIFDIGDIETVANVDLPWSA